MSRPSRRLPQILSVLFAAAVVGISIVVILQERESRQQAASPDVATDALQPVQIEQPEDAGQPATAPPTTPGTPDSGALNLHPTNPRRDDRFTSRSQETSIPVGIKTIRSLPRTREELATAFEGAEADRCELLPAGQPLELTSFTPYLTDRDRRASTAPIPSLRRAAFTVGLTLSSEEQGRLPALSRGKIVDYIEGHYINVQARVQRDPSSRIRYLHHRPLAAVAKYSGARVTQDAEPAIASSVHDFRSLGLLVDRDRSLTTADMRTLVIIHMHQRLEELASGAVERRPDYELAFIHARPSDTEGVEPLELHSFVTSEGRTRLHHLRSRVPSQAGACDIRANVRLTEFTHAGMYPTQAMVREVFIADKAAYGLEELDGHIREQGWSGDIWDHLPKLFDAIIDPDKRISQSHRVDR